MEREEERKLFPAIGSCTCGGCVLSRSVTSEQLFATPWTVARQAPLSMGFFRQYWSGQPFPSRGDLPDPGIGSPTLQADSLISQPPWKPECVGWQVQSLQGRLVSWEELLLQLESEGRLEAEFLPPYGTSVVLSLMAFH